MIDKMLTRWLVKKQMKHLENSQGFKTQKLALSAEGKMLMELIVSVAQITNVTPEQLAEQMTKKERFNWFMGELTKAQIEKTEELLREVGDTELVDRLNDLKETIKKEGEKDADKNK